MARSMKLTTHLPTELWIVVLDILDFSDLKAISLTCRNFRSFATPRLFRRLSIGLSSKGWYLRKPGHPRFFSPGDMTLSAASPLLAFYSSEHVAPLVREVWLSAYTGRYSQRQPSIEVVLDLLHLFSNVQNVGLTSLHVAQSTMQTIAQLPALVSITMSRCVYGNWEGPLLRLKYVSLFCDYPPDGEVKWPFTVQPELLESLHVDAFTFPNFSSLPNLRTLRVSGDDEGTTSVIRCLDFLTKCNCPSLDTLILPRCRFELATFDTSTLHTIPCLKVYHGPGVIIPPFAAGGSLRRALLRGSTWPDDPTPEDFADSLHKLHALAPNLVALAIDVVCPSEAIARAIHQFCALEELCIQTRNRDPKLMQCFFATLNSQPLPLTLRRVEIRTRVRPRTSDLSEQHVLNAMQIDLPLPCVLARTLRRRNFIYAYKRHTRDAIINDATVDVRDELGSDSDADSDTTY